MPPKADIKPAGRKQLGRETENWGRISNAVGRVLDLAAGR
jgi:hypothetical protein